MLLFQQNMFNLWFDSIKSKECQILKHCSFIHIVHCFFVSGLIKYAVDSIFYRLISPEQRGQTAQKSPYRPKLPSSALFLICSKVRKESGSSFSVSQDDLHQTTEATVTSVFTYLFQRCLIFVRHSICV